MKKLTDWFNSHDGRTVIKHSNYLDVYEKWLSEFINKKPIVLEIGVCHGGSLQMWKNYFGDGCQIIGIDINPNCIEAEEDGIKVYIGDQTDIEFLESVLEKIGTPNIIIDDGGHTMKQQKISFEFLFPQMAYEGIYICEDLHTSYWKKNYGGGLRKRGTFIEYTKELIDHLHAFHIEGQRLNPSYFTENIGGIHFYDSVVVVEKTQVKQPSQIQAGNRTIEPLRKIVWHRHPRKWIKSILNK